MRIWVVAWLVVAAAIGAMIFSGPERTYFVKGVGVIVLFMGLLLGILELASMRRRGQKPRPVTGQDEDKPRDGAPPETKGP